MKPEKMFYAHLNVGQSSEPRPERKHGHYFKQCPYTEIDVYRVIDLFEVVHPCAQHVLKKAIAAGNRGHKDLDHDIQDMIDTLQRWQKMRIEDGSST